MPASIACAKAGITTGEWGATLREVFGEFRAPTGVGTHAPEPAEDTRLLVADLADTLGHAPRLLVGKPGLDGHSNGAEQIALRAGAAGFDVTYDGIRRTPDEIVARAREQKVDAIGLSILSGSHVPLVREVMARLREAGLDHIPVVVGGIIPEADALALGNIGVKAVYTPKDYRIDAIVADLCRVIGRQARGLVFRRVKRLRTSRASPACGTASPQKKPDPEGPAQSRDRSVTGTSRGERPE